MVDAFMSKIRPLGTSLGIIIPKDVVAAKSLEVGMEVKVSLLNPDSRKLERLFGSLKNAKPFERQRRNRI